ncbi:transporter substrate-binding domain-containing protein [Pseudactinotalea sp. Z1732]|uniref:transporter substrate-binding domain-containing protein n=1 Tax=Pseudactinotalea sp. Z1732 TaxID=3413026 RepID=UPI003C7B4468
MKNTSRRMMALTATAAAATLALAACGNGDGDGLDDPPPVPGQEDEGNGDENGDANGDGGTLAELQEAGSISVGFAGEEPYSYTDDSGELTGATIALHREVFASMGIETVEGTEVDWDALIPGLNAGRFDAVSAGMSILPERCEQASFSNPEIMYTTAFMVPEGNPNDLHDMQDVQEAGVTFAAMNGAVEESYAQALGIDLMTVNTPQDGMDAVVSGRADVYALTGISLRAMAENNPDQPVEVTEAFEAVVDGEIQVGAGATVFRDADTDLLDAYNEAAAEIIGDPAEFERVLGPFGFTEAERPTDEVSTEMLCEGDLPTVEE